MKQGSAVWWLRALLLAIAAGISLVLFPLLFGDNAITSSDPDLHGAPEDDGVVYNRALVADLLDDIAVRTGFRVVAFADIGERSFSGKLVIGSDGKRAVRTLAKKLGLELRKAGPHWVLVEPD